MPCDPRESASAFSRDIRNTTVLVAVVVVTTLAIMSFLQFWLLRAGDRYTPADALRDQAAVEERISRNEQRILTLEELAAGKGVNEE